MFAEFLITDGTTTLDLLAANKRGNGFALTRYTPGRPTLKGGGIWQDSPLAQGRRLAHGTHGNINDAVELKITYPSHEEIILACQELDLLLEKAATYWTTDWQDEPVYIIARAPGESNSRYAVIHYASFGEYPDPYQEPYAGRGRRFVMDGIILGLERGAWQSAIPGADTQIQLSHAFDPATTDFVYISNYRENNGITSIRRSDNLAVELIDTVPLTIFPTGAVNDAIYFGSPVKFYTLVFNLGTAMAASSHTIVWEVSHTSDFGNYAVSQWVTSDLDETGKFMVRIVPDDTATTEFWDTLQVGGVGDMMYWVRLRVTASSLVTAVPIQQNSQVYVPSLPYVDVAASAIGGDLPAAIRARFLIDKLIQFSPSNINNIIVGSRSLSRGEDFVAYVNVDNDYNPAGLSVTIADTAILQFTNSSSIGKIVLYFPTIFNEYVTALMVEIDSSVVQQYYGEYRLLVRGRLTETTALYGSKQLWRATIQYADGVDFFRTNPVEDAPSASYFRLNDLGRIKLPTSNIRSSESTGTVQILIEALASEVRIKDVILMPVDEWSVQSIVQTAYTGTSVEVNYVMDLDGTTLPKDKRRAILKTWPGEAIIGQNSVIANGEFTLSANTATRVWVVAETHSAESHVATAIKLYAAKRYHHLRSG